MQNSVSEISLLVGVKDDLGALIVGEGRTGRNELFVYLDFEDVFGCFIPDENCDLLDIVISLTEIMLVR